MSKRTVCLVRQGSLGNGNCNESSLRAGHAAALVLPADWPVGAGAGAAAPVVEVAAAAAAATTSAAAAAAAGDGRGEGTFGVGLYLLDPKNVSSIKMFDIFSCERPSPKHCPKGPAVLKLLRRSKFTTLWHVTITKIIPWELVFVIFEGFCALEMSRKERHVQGITCEIRKFSENNYFWIIFCR